MTLEQFGKDTWATTSSMNMAQGAPQDYPRDQSFMGPLDRANDPIVHSNRLERSPYEQAMGRVGNPKIEAQQLAANVLYEQHAYAERQRKLSELEKVNAEIAANQQATQIQKVLEPRPQLLNRAERDIIRLVSGHRNNTAGKSLLSEALLLLSALIEVEYGQW